MTYIIKTPEDSKILKKCRQLEKLPLSKQDRVLVRLIKDQLLTNWRKSLIDSVDILLEEYTNHKAVLTLGKKIK